MNQNIRVCMWVAIALGIAIFVYSIFSSNLEHGMPQQNVVGALDAATAAGVWVIAGILYAHVTKK